MSTGNDDSYNRMRLDDLKELLMTELHRMDAVGAERNARYEQQFMNNKQAVDAALAAQKEATSAAFAASERAITKAEEAQKDYNVRSNEFRGQLDDQAKTLMPRSEANVRFMGLEEKIAALREGESHNRGRSGGTDKTIAYIFAGLGALATITSLFIAFSR